MSERPKGSLSFQTRITTAAMGTSVCVLVLACTLFTLQQWSGDRGRLAYNQHRAAEVLAPRVADVVRTSSRTRVRKVLEDSAIVSRLRSAEVLDRTGRLVARFDQKSSSETVGEPLVTATPILADGRPVGVLRLTSAVEPFSAVIPRYIGLSGALFFAAMGCSLFLGRLMAKHVLEPVRRLSGVMGEIAVSGDLARRVEVAAEDEIGRLITSFNTLLARLEANEATLRKTLDELVVARDQAEAANVQKSHFLANMSHEIRTPLNGVLAMAQIMALGSLTEEQRGRLDVIRNSGQALLTILNDILDVSKIEAGALVLEAVDFDVEDLVRSAAESFSAVAEGKNVSLDVAIEEGLCATRVGDPARLRQILANLISNALKFTADGRVEVRVETSRERTGGLRFSVADTGIGMPADKISLLFQKFTQLDSSTTRKFGGTGLGLAICAELSTMMGGRIWVESVEGAGSTFFVDLPLPATAAPRAASETEVVEGEENERPLRVLAAEDNATNQLVLTTILEIFGAELQIVENGADAVTAALSQTFDIILMDIQMPVMDGITAAREIRRRERETGRVRTPIIAVSANAMAHQVREYLAAGMDGHVPKPIEISQLQQTLEQVLAGAPTGEDLVAARA